MSEKKKVSINDIIKMKGAGRKITVVTAYDYPFGLIADKAGFDIILVGDSGGTSRAGPAPVGTGSSVKRPRSSRSRPDRRGAPFHKDSREPRCGNRKTCGMG